MDDYLLISKVVALQLAIPVVFCCFIAFVIGHATARLAIGKRHVARVVVLCNMFSFYGVVLGFLIGASQESMARDAFSGIVTILSAYFGYLLSKDIHPRLKAMIPAAVTCFLIAFLVSVTYFLKVRKAFGLEG